MSDKLNKIAQYEKAISQKYGNEAVDTPKKDWSEQKEEEYSPTIKRSV